MKSSIFGSILLFTISVSAWAGNAVQVTPMVFVQEYIREIGELNKLTNEIKSAPKNEAESFSNMVYIMEKIQISLQQNINILSTMRLGGQLDDLPSNLSKFYIQKKEIMSDLSSSASDMIAPDTNNAEAMKKISDNLKNLPKLRAQNEHIDESIGKTMNSLVFLSLVDPSGDGQGHTSKLIITKAEKDALLEKLRSEFGAKIEESGEAPWYLFAGQIFYSALKTHKGKDEFANGTVSTK